MANRFVYVVRHGDAVDDGVLSETGLEQARLVGQRLKSIPFAGIHHSPLPRAVQTAQLIAEHLPQVPIHSSGLLGDYVPFAPDRADLPSVYAQLFDGYSAAELTEGAALARATIERFAVPAEEDTHELIVTHNFLIAWFVRHALGAPPQRWLGLNQGNCGLSVILYRSGRLPSLMAFNDMGHLPVRLRWTGFPAGLAF